MEKHFACLAQRIVTLAADTAVTSIFLVGTEKQSFKKTNRHHLHLVENQYQGDRWMDTEGNLSQLLV
jgi:hypothetical protein